MRRLADPVAVGLVSLLVYALHGFGGGLNRDQGVFTYGGEHVAHGVPPYVGIFNSVGPLADAVPGLGIWLGHLIGVGPLLSARVLFTCLSALCCALLCVLARDTFDSRAAGLLAPAVFLTFEKFLQLATDGPREKTTMVVFLLATLILAGRRRWLAAGVATALGTLTWQPVLFVAVAVVVVSVLTDGPGRIRALARFVLGGAIPTLLTVAWFALEGALHQALNGFVVVNLLYTTQPSAFLDPRATWLMLWDGYHATLLVALAGLVLMLTLAVRAVPFVRRSAGYASPVPRRLLSIGAGCLTGSLWTAAVINGSPDLFELLPFAALGVTGAVLLLLTRLTRRTGTVLVACLVSLCVVAAGAESVTTRDRLLLLQRADVNAVLGTQPKDATILSLGAPEVLSIAERDNLWPWQLFDPRMQRFLDHTQPGGLPGLARRLSTEQPTFIVKTPGYGGNWYKPVLAREYRRVGTGPGWAWYVSRTVGRAAARRARAMNAQVMGSQVALRRDAPSSVATAGAGSR